VGLHFSTALKSKRRNGVLTNPNKRGRFRGLQPFRSKSASLTILDHDAGLGIEPSGPSNPPAEMKDGRASVAVNYFANGQLISSIRGLGETTGAAAIESIDATNSLHELNDTTRKDPDVLTNLSRTAGLVGRNKAPRARCLTTSATGFPPLRF